MERRFRLVDVFGEGEFSGNPLAVVHGAEGMEAAAMLRITQWLNLSETTFLLDPTDPGADYLVRIFTPERELPFAGHPTLGSCHAWLEAGGVARDAGSIVQQCGAGLIPVRPGRFGSAETALRCPLGRCAADATSSQATMQVLLMRRLLFATMISDERDDALCWVDTRVTAGSGDRRI